MRSHSFRKQKKLLTRSSTVRYNRSHELLLRAGHMAGGTGEPITKELYGFEYRTNLHECRSRLHLYDWHDYRVWKLRHLNLARRCIQPSCSYVYGDAVNGST